MRRHLTYANVAATLALVFAMGGAAMAASHYVINSTKQINPKVLKALRGRAGHTGKAGAAGPQGKEGTQGKEGAAGKEGPAGPFPSGPLPRGATLRGQYNVRFDAPGAAFLAESISFGFEFASAPEVRWVAPGATPPAECANNTPAPGFLCFYSEETRDLQNAGAFNEASQFGAKVEIEAAAGGDAFDFGTWAATSP